MQNVCVHMYVWRGEVVCDWSLRSCSMRSQRALQTYFCWTITRIGMLQRDVLQFTYIKGTKQLLTGKTKTTFDSHGYSRQGLRNARDSLFLVLLFAKINLHGAHQAALQSSTHILSFGLMMTIPGHV